MEEKILQYYSDYTRLDDSTLEIRLENEYTFYVKIVNQTFLDSKQYGEYIKGILDNSTTLPLFLYDTDKGIICLIAYSLWERTLPNYRPIWMEISRDNIEMINCFVKSLKSYICLLPLTKLRVIRTIRTLSGDGKEMCIKYTREFDSEYKMRIISERNDRNRLIQKRSEEEYPYDALDYEIISQVKSRFQGASVTSDILLVNTSLRDALINKQYPRATIDIRFVPMLMSPNSNPRVCINEEQRIQLEVFSLYKACIQEMQGQVWDVYYSINNENTRILKEQLKRYQTYTSALL